LVCIGLDGCNNLHVSCSVSSNDGHILLWLRKVCVWLRKGYVGHRKIWWGMAAPLHPCLHWYITVVTRRRRGSSKFCCAPPSWAVEKPSPIILLFYFFFAGTRGPSLTNLLSPQEKKS
jgi:hypothetical protein